MQNKVLYIVTILIWGSTWFAIKFQLGEIEIVVSIFYRFFLAALIMLVFCLYKKIDLRFSMAEHGFILLLALGNFSINYTILYSAQQYINSAMTSITFSTLLLMNIINTRIFFGKPIALRIYIGASIGVMGIIVIFWRDLQLLDASKNLTWGLLLALSGTLVASLGNMVSVRNSKHKMNIFATNTWGMFYGSLFLFVYSFTQGLEFNFSFQTSYILSLLYLALFGSVIAFASYFTLLKNIGPEKASYIIVLSPMVSVIISILFEDFNFNYNIIAGFLLVILGNIIVLTQASAFKNILKFYFQRKTHFETNE